MEESQCGDPIHLSYLGPIKVGLPTRWPEVIRCSRKGGPLDWHSTRISVEYFAFHQITSWLWVCVDPPHWQYIHIYICMDIHTHICIYIHITLHYMTLYYTTLHCITLHLQYIYIFISFTLTLTLTLHSHYINISFAFRVHYINITLTMRTSTFH